jgi:isopentenyl-diphosphate delta-isomerase
VLVDADDKPLGVEAVLACHLSPGRKHRAFSAVVMDDQGRVLLARRAAGKMLWHGSWDATVASHPRPGEGYVEAAERRVREELGVACELHLLGRFDYRVDFGDVGTEDEVCAALVGRLAPGTEPRPDAAEIDGLRVLSADALVAELSHRPEDYCPWTYLALLCAGVGEDGLPPDLASDLCRWREPALRGALRGGLLTHLSDDAWRLLDGGESAA